MFVAFENLPENARVWVYQSNRFFTEMELSSLGEALASLCNNWHTHNQPQKASFLLPFNRFVILAADESMFATSGCSTDRSVNFLKVAEQEMGISLFDRTELTYLNEQKELLACNMQAFSERITKGEITPQTLVFNNLVSNKTDFTNKWILPLAESWHSRMFKQALVTEV